MSTMTDKMSQASSTTTPVTRSISSPPKKGDRFRCQKCGMELQVTADCKCSDSNMVHLSCCGQELEKV